MSWDLPGAAPLFATPRNPRLRTEGRQVDAVARSLSTPLIPWQQYVSDVAGERRPDGSYEHQVVVVSVPRQCGKTTELRAVGTHRALVNGRDVYYTAQTGKDARERWEDLVKQVQVTPAYQGRYRLMRRGGSERIVFRERAGFHVFAPTPESLHGYTPPTVMIDEAFSLSGAAGELLMGAIGPAQITIRDRQLWIVSTAGTAESVFLHDWIDRGIEGTPRVAAFVWGASDDHDPYDPADVARFHPGIGFPLNGKILDPSDVLEQADRNSRAEYERAYANRRTLTTAQTFPAEDWRLLAVDQAPDWTDTHRLILGFEVAPDRQSAAVVAAQLDAAGVPVGRIVQAGPGVAWLAPALSELARHWRPAQLVAAASGPARDVVDQLGRDGWPVTAMTEPEVAAATGAFVSAFREGHVRHDPTDDGGVLEASVTGLALRTSAADGTTISRARSAGDPAPGVAFILATHAAAAAPAWGGPLIDFGQEGPAA